MNIIYHPSQEAVEQAMKHDEPFLMVISFDGETIAIAPVDEAVEHHVLLSKVGFSSMDIDKFFRILFDKSGADWTFICPPDYRGIPNREKRIAEFYKDGFNAIAKALQSFGYYVGIDIPKRYRRHLDELGDRV